MSKRSSDVDLGPPIEAALAGFPFPERDWEANARRVQGRISGEPSSAVDDALFVAPFPGEPGEPGEPRSSPVGSETERAPTPRSGLSPAANVSTGSVASPLSTASVRTTGFAELARRTVEKERASRRDMARQSLALAAQQPVNSARAQDPRDASQAPSSASSSDEAATDGRADATAALGGGGPESAIAAASGGERGVREVETRARQARAASAWPKLAVAASGLALAAVLLLWLKVPTRAPSAAARDESASAASAASAVTPGAPLAVQRDESPASAPEAMPTGIDPRSLPEEVTPKPSARDEALGSSAKPAMASPTQSARASAEKAKAVVAAKSESAPSAPAATALAEAPVSRAAPEPALRPADNSGGGLPEKPSLGAAQAALGAVLGGARRCLAGESEASRAEVTFGSDGHVQQVSVNGPATGKPAAACIQTELARARVQPFAAPSFRVSTTVRPN